MGKQVGLFEDFRTAEEGAAVFCHQDFLQKVEENRRGQVGKRASLLLERLAVDPRREFYKSTLGVNKGWRRSRLGGHGGNQFYAWWAPKGAPPLRDWASADIPDSAVFLRDIRHHDDHSELRPQSFTDYYLPLTVRDLRSEEYVPSPLTSTQAQFTSSRHKIRIIKGYPGSGKTTALWHAADASASRSTLYVTYSKDLAELAKTHFQRFAPAHKEFHVFTFARLVRELCASTAPPVPERESRARFLKELGALPPRVLGPWADDRKALYDEIHANLVGAALPVAVGRFPACDRPRVPDRTYREYRRRFIGGAAADAVLEVVNTLARRQPDFNEVFFPELLLAWKAVAQLRSGNLENLAARKLLGFDCIAVDEAQDLTPIEALALTSLAAAIRDRTRGVLTLLVAGDEAQTVRATDFEWGWFHDMLHHQVGNPEEFKLGVNLRSPRRIARVINAVWGLYSTMAKQDRPGGAREAEIEEEASDQLVYCAASPGPELEQLLRAFADREGLAIICLAEQLPDYVPAELRHRILSVTEAKGLDFQAVCVLDPGAQLFRILTVAERVRRDSSVEPLSRRLAIDQFRVAVSRPTERIYFLDVAPSETASRQMQSFLKWADEGNEIAPAIPAAVLKSLEEELLEPEERVRLCEIDARQYLEVKPEMAWTRAKQAVALLGRAGDRQSVADETVRASAQLTLAQVSFTLAMRETALPRELGQPDLFSEAEEGALAAGRRMLAAVLHSTGSLRRHFSQAGLLLLAQTIAKYPQEIEPWLALELSTRARNWLEEVEKAAADTAFALSFLEVLPAVYKVYGVVDAAERIVKLRRQAVQMLMAAGHFQPALDLIAQDPDAPQSLKAECYEGLDRHLEAAEVFRAMGKPKEALRNYRAIPDVGKALELMRELGDQPAAESLEWLAELTRLLEKRPKNLARVATAAEKKYLAALLEAQLDGPRVKKTPRPRTPRAKTKTPARRGGVKREEYF